MRFSNIAIAALSFPLWTGEGNQDEVSEEISFYPCVGMYDAYGNFFHQHTTTGHGANGVVYGDASSIDDYQPIDLTQNPPPSSAAAGVELKNPPNYVEFSGQFSGASNDSLDDPIDLGVLRELAVKPMECVSNPVINETGELLAMDFRELVASCHRYGYGSCPERYNVGLECWNTSLMVNMSNALADLDGFTDDISMWDVSNVVDMHSMFALAYDFNADLSRWQTGNVIDMTYMFYGLYNFDSDLSQWETGNVTDMYGMFFYAMNFTSDISLWDTGKVTDMSNMFSASFRFNSDLSLWVTDKVQKMYGMFADAKEFNSDLSSWQTGNVTDTSFMFYRAQSFNSDLSMWATDKVKQMYAMFSDAKKFNSDISSWKTGNINDTSYMFYEAQSFNQNLASWQVGKVTDARSMFYGAKSFNQCLRSWAARTPDGVDTDRMFLGSSCPNQSDPDPRKGPWCQGFEERCFDACSDADEFRFGKDNQKSCASINDISAPTEKELKRKLRRTCKKLAFPNEIKKTAQAPRKIIRIKHVCREACGSKGFGPGKRCNF